MNVFSYDEVLISFSLFGYKIITVATAVYIKILNTTLKCFYPHFEKKLKLTIMFISSSIYIAQLYTHSIPLEEDFFPSKNNELVLQA